ncbi:MAG: efflux RND transporter periplasmic adaptor subunit [Deltaproteobacteria bacterium]|nr:efflux RND transporter periplasmic adaptor subunit [Deltaproteobacteria bacterium]
MKKKTRKKNISWVQRLNSAWEETWNALRYPPPWGKWVAVALLVAATGLLGVWGGYQWARQSGSSSTAGSSAPPRERRILFYRNPMDPQVTSPVPAKDNMGMDFIPVYADEGTENGRQDPAGTVRIDPDVVQNIGVRTGRVEKHTLSNTIQTLGLVAYNEEKLARLHPKSDGWVEKLFVDKTGERVKKGTILLSVYSPDLVSAQEEYLLALKQLTTLGNNTFPDIRKGAENMLRTSREKLEWLDVPAHQIKNLEATGKITKNLHIHSPFSGVVTRVGVREGMRITPQTELYTLADLSQVWVLADVYEAQIPWVRLGDQADIRLTAIPGKTYRGRISYVYPYLDPATRTVKVRVAVDNPGLALKPDMFADVTLHTDRQVNILAIPSEAVVRTGTREQVYVVRGGGKFEPRPVRLGVASQGLVQVLEGLSEGEVVVTSAQFLIDSDSSLREAAGKMSAPGPVPVPVPVPVPSTRPGAEDRSRFREEPAPRSVPQSGPRSVPRSAPAPQPPTEHSGHDAGSMEDMEDMDDMNHN